jgi:uncharacterized protein YndB with AHSA1/START domain
VIERELFISAPPEIVYRLLTDGEAMASWMGRHVSADARPGGMLRIDYNGFDIMRGDYVALEPHTRVVFTWGWESEGSDPRAGGSTVEFRLEDVSGGTQLRMVHSLPAATVEPHSQGWDHFLERLTMRAEGRDPGVDPWSPTRSELLAAEIRNLFAELGRLIESSEAGRWAAATGDGWSAIVMAAHMLDHLGHAEFAAATARGERDRRVDLPMDAIHARNAQAAIANAGLTADALLARCRAEVAPAVALVRGIDPAALGNGSAMAFADGQTLTAEDILERLLLRMGREHIESIEVALRS